MALKAHQGAQNKAEIALLIASCDEQMGSIGSAIKWCQQAIANEPDHLESLYRLAELLFNNRDYDEAEKMYARLNRIKAEDLTPISRLAYIYYQQGDLAKEYAFLLQLKHAGVLESRNRPRIVHCFSSLPGKVDYPGVEKDISDFLDYDNVDHTKLSWKISYLLAARYTMSEEERELELTDLIQDQLLVKALPRVFFISPEIETLLTTVRSSLLLDIAYSQNLPNLLVPFVESLALQNQLNEYVYYVSDKEKEILKLFSQLLQSHTDQDDWSPRESELILLMLAMYGQLYDLLPRERLLSVPLESWPESLQAIAWATLFEVKQELESARLIPTLTEVDDETSQAVQAQYESNPYPRWDNLDRWPGETFGQSMAAVLPGYTPPACLLEEKINILVAGCGTGRQPLALALQLPHSSITAVDISRRSLAYAAEKAAHYQVNNVQFFQADILKLGELEQHFHLIVSTGVLHHLAAPLVGWQILRNLLLPEGILQIDLYSRVARVEITRHREILAQLEMTPTPENIRRYRQALAKQEPDSFILQIMDFYNLSMCRDLLFHVQEHQFTWPQIQKCCDQLEMEFVGVHARPQLYQQYRALFPDDPQCRDLQNWHRLELEFPQSFWGMYSFWCKQRELSPA
ncbi:methyltransferase domain-containing protein [Desulfogranum mediterraneum]|uniref:methyltransferase domain-containing protein n=1 Tax=Desulfogranum mediterraneum TaxID=160661 RepID=UPI001378F9FB|nr:methyltransferase domain-containing protein [Desulfogranum mediterraneum]